MHITNYAYITAHHLFRPSTAALWDLDAITIRAAWTAGNRYTSGPPSYGTPSYGTPCSILYFVIASFSPVTPTQVSNVSNSSSRIIDYVLIS